mgnify:CR=1 FL=1
MKFPKRFFQRKPETLQELLTKKGITIEQVEKLQNLSFDIMINDSNRKIVEKLGGIENLQVKKGPSQLLGGEVLSCISSAITILQTLFFIEKWLSSKVIVTINTPNGNAVKLTVNDAIMYIIRKAQKKE